MNYIEHENDHHCVFSHWECTVGCMSILGMRLRLRVVFFTNARNEVHDVRLIKVKIFHKVHMIIGAEGQRLTMQS